ncbi:Ig-like domain-containing protein [Alteromonas flava]|uniref:Ig-like domain-containing protein n=1 Tax=Alteromonas flava TaxID=2048003 RepID=UPI000C28D0AC|nr:Ig-like domain-containing protein [Alteromonas flava]
MNPYRYFLISLLSLFIIACNGSSGENEEPSPTPDPVVVLALSVLDADCQPVTENSFKSNENACIEATLTTDGSPTSNAIVAFSSGIGILDVASKLTDSNGIARVAISAENGVIGASTVTANYNNLQAEASIEFTLADAVPAPAEPSITLNMLNQSGENTLRFKANQQVRLIATLMDGNNNPIADEIVSFSVTRGDLPVTDALTNQQGIAEVIVRGEETSIGAGIASVSALDDSNTPLVDTLNYEVQSVDAVEEEVVRIGYFDGDTFIEGVLGVNGVGSEQDVVIGAGATLGLLVGLADSEGNPIVGSTPITFASSCTLEGRASLDENVATVNGRASSTYEDINCAGGTGNDDIITATVQVNNTPLTVSRSIELLAENVGSILFVSAEPSSIVLQGTGGLGSESVSTVTFQVNGELGNPLAQQLVSFELSTNVGGLTIAPATGITNSQGQVSTRVTAGSVPTAVRVLASITGVNDTEITTQSDLLSVNTGLPDQNSFSLSSSNPNPEAASIDGQTVSITAFLADAFNNPVPDGTVVSFTTEGGQIQPSCTTLNGRCEVDWTSAEPRVDDHRITVLATAIGHETLYDSNGNNVYDDADGGALDLGGDSGLQVTSSTVTGFADMSEAWRDDNENNIHDPVETFLDYDSSGAFSAANNLFDGPQCQGSTCGASGLHVRRALVMIMASSRAELSILQDGVELANNSNNPSSGPVWTLNRGESVALDLLIQDTAGQTMPSDTNIDITTSAGSLAGQITRQINKNNRAGGATMNFVLTNDLASTDDPIDAVVSTTVTSPSGVESALSIIVRLL